MKKALSVVFIIALIFSLYGCDILDSNNTDNAQHTYVITFVYNNGTDPKTETVKRSEKVTKPLNPTKTNCVFDNWYESGLIKIFDFSTAITSDKTLYAKWTVDYPTIQNTVMTTQIKACVKLEVKFYNTFLGIETESKTVTGSGVIFYEGKYSNTNNHYYEVLTNNHVTFKSAEYAKYSNRSIKIIDSKGNKYDAVFNKADAEYDLSLVYFTKNIELHVIKRATKNPTVNQELISIGEPQGQTNTVTYGEVLQYRNSNVNGTTFNNILVHSAPSAGGSSGGPVLDTNLNLVGINFAGSDPTDFSNSGYTCAMPIEKVAEFLNKYFWA